MIGVPAPEPGALDAATRALVELTAARNDGRPLAIVERLAHRPELVEPFLVWSAALAGAAALGRRRHELAALRTAWHHRSDYEWGTHARAAREAGWSDEEIATLADPAVAHAGFDAGDRALLGLVDAMCAAASVDPAVRDAAIEALGIAGYVEAVWTVGQYAGLSLVAAALGLASEPGTVPIPPD